MVMPNDMPVRSESAGLAIAALTRRVRLFSSIWLSMADTVPAHSADVSRAVIAASMLRERKIVVARLQRLGVHIVEAHHEQIGTELVNAYLGLKRRNLL